MTDDVGLRSFPGPSTVGLQWGAAFDLSSLHCQIDQTHLRLPFGSLSIIGRVRRQGRFGLLVATDSELSVAFNS